MRTLLSLAAPLALLAASGCGSAEPADAPTSEARAVWVGSIDGTDSRIGLVREGAHVGLYVCGGSTSIAATRWFRGDVRADGTIELANNGVTVRAQLRNDRVWEGTFTMAPDPARNFRIVPALPDTPEDVYEATLDGGNAGVIVLRGVPEVGMTMQGVFRALDGSTFQVLPVRTVERTPQGLEVRVILATGARDFFVRPARAKL